MSTSICQQCNTTNPPDAAFCGECGAPVKRSAPSQWLLAGIGLVIGGGLWTIAIIVSLNLQPPAATEATVAGPNAPVQSAAPSPSPEMTTAARLAQARRFEQTDPTTAVVYLEQIPATAPEHREAQRMLNRINARLARERAQAERERIPQLRETLRLNYQMTVARTFPNLNFIRSKYTRVGNGYALWATHDFFSQYTFSIGSQAYAVQRWIGDHQTELEQAGIVRVGVMGEGPYASWTYFNVR